MLGLRPAVPLITLQAVETESTRQFGEQTVEALKSLNSLVNRQWKLCEITKQFGEQTVEAL